MNFCAASWAKSRGANALRCGQADTLHGQNNTLRSGKDGGRLSRREGKPYLQCLFIWRLTQLFVTIYGAYGP
jgi:hypothetical protein